MRDAFNQWRTRGVQVDISKWNTSSVTDMHGMFRYANKFDSDISAWDVSSVTSMDSMFESAHKFTCDITRWYTPSLVQGKTKNMFRDATNLQKIFVRQHGFRHATQSNVNDVATTTILNEKTDGPASMWE